MARAVAKVGIVTTGGTEAEKAVTDFAEAMKAVETAAAKTEKSLATSGRGLAVLGVQSEIGLEKMRAAIAKLPAPTDAQREALARLEKQTAVNIGRANDFNDRLQAQKTRIGDVDEVLRGISPQLANLALKWSIASEAMNFAESALREVSGGLNETAKALGGTGKEFEALNSKFIVFGILKQEMPKVLGLIKDFSAASGSMSDKIAAVSDALERQHLGMQTEVDDLAAAEDALGRMNKARDRAREKIEKSEAAHEGEAAAVDVNADAVAAYNATLAESARAADQAATGSGKLTNSLRPISDAARKASADVTDLASAWRTLWTSLDATTSRSDQAAEMEKEIAPLRAEADRLAARKRQLEAELASLDTGLLTPDQQGAQARAEDELFSVRQKLLSLMRHLAVEEDNIRAVRIRAADDARQQAALDQQINDDGSKAQQTKVEELAAIGEGLKAVATEGRDVATVLGEIDGLLDSIMRKLGDAEG